MLSMVEVWGGRVETVAKMQKIGSFTYSKKNRQGITIQEIANIQGIESEEYSKQVS